MERHALCGLADLGKSRALFTFSKPVARASKLKDKAVVAVVGPVVGGSSVDASHIPPAGAEAEVVAPLFDLEGELAKQIEEEGELAFGEDLLESK